MRAAGIVLAAGLVGCATSDFGPGTVLRSAVDTPESFVADAPPELFECMSPLRDARNGVRLTLVRSQDGEGDYAVEGARYGVGRGELLRVDCGNGAAIGIVRR
ncbi:MAG: hypothetical protein WD081_05320 [Gammaproteobacteria bacterium]